MIAETTAAIVAAIIGAVTAIVTTSASIITTLTSKEFKSSTVPADSKKKMVFLQGHLKQITDSLRGLDASIKKEASQKQSVLDKQLANLDDAHAKELRIAMEEIQIALTSIEASIQTSTTETDLAIFFSWVFKLVDDLECLLATNWFKAMLYDEKFWPGHKSVKRQIDVINSEYPPIETDNQYFQITNTHDSKRYRMSEYLGSGPGWGIVCWDMGRFDIRDTYWILRTHKPRKKDPKWTQVTGDWVFLCDEKDDQNDRQVLFIIKEYDMTRKLIKHGSFAQQGNVIDEKNRWTLEDFADNSRRLREGDWVAIRLRDDGEKNPYISVSPRGVVVDHFDSKSIQFDQQPGSNNVEWDGIWLIENRTKSS